MFFKITTKRVLRVYLIVIFENVSIIYNTLKFLLVLKMLKTLSKITTKPSGMLSD